MAKILLEANKELNIVYSKLRGVLRRGNKKTD